MIALWVFESLPNLSAAFFNCSFTITVCDDRQRSGRRKGCDIAYNRSKSQAVHLTPFEDKNNAEKLKVNCIHLCDPITTVNPLQLTKAGIKPAKSKQALTKSKQQ